MSRVKAPLCPHPKCRTRMVRAYVRKGPGYPPVGWVCPECHMFIPEGKDIVLKSE